MSPNIDWRAHAACRTEDPDLFFPVGTTGVYLLQIEEAKAICRRCPVTDTCLTEALREEGGSRDRAGIRGGLTDAERRTLRRQQTRGSGIPRTRHLPLAKSLAEALSRRSQQTAGGHLHWDGVPHLTFQGRRYTVLRAAFIVGYGREPVGIVRRACTDGECIQFEHLSDEAMRDAEDRCGTRSGYLQHLARGEDCGRCRTANTGRDNRLRRTGTTKRVAA